MLVSSICRSSVGQSYHVDGGPSYFSAKTAAGPGRENLVTLVDHKTTPDPGKLRFRNRYYYLFIYLIWLIVLFNNRCTRTIILHDFLTSFFYMLRKVFKAIYGNILLINSTNSYSIAHVNNFLMLIRHIWFRLQN